MLPERGMPSLLFMRGLLRDHERTLFGAIDARQFPEWEKCSSLQCCIGDGFVVGERPIELIGKENTCCKEHEHHGFPFLRKGKSSDLFHLRPYNAKEDETENEREEVMVEVHDSVDLTNRDHVADVESEEGGEEKRMRELLAQREEEGREEEDDCKEDAKESKKPRHRIHLK